MRCFEVPNKNFDLKGAVYAAATEFCQTEEGRRIYDYNCCCFNWADFSVSVPNEFCKKYGFKKKLEQESPDFSQERNALFLFFVSAT